MMFLNAYRLSLAWSSVALAQGSDSDRVGLYRTTLVEAFTDEGVRLVSTDGHLLLKAWVPADESIPEPGGDVLPDQTAVCSDRDGRVLALMRYALSLTRKDGVDTPVTVVMGVGDMGNQHGVLDGLSQACVWFRLGHEYDERIEAPQYEGAFPNWRPVWFGHQHQQTGIVAFPANTIARLGKLSALWEKAAIEFALGGKSGVARLKLRAANVFVDGLCMPSDPAETADATTPVPPSEEGIHAEYADALDEFLADVLAEEHRHDNEPDPMVAEALAAQVARAAALFLDLGHATPDVLAERHGLNTERACEIVAELAALGFLDPFDDLDPFAKLGVLATDLSMFDTGSDAIDDIDDIDDDPL